MCAQGGLQFQANTFSCKQGLLSVYRVTYSYNKWDCLWVDRVTQAECDCVWTR